MQEIQVATPPVWWARGRLSAPGLSFFKKSVSLEHHDVMAACCVCVDIHYIHTFKYDMVLKPILNPSSTCVLFRTTTGGEILLYGLIRDTCTGIQTE